MEPKYIKVISVKCPECKLNIVVKPTDKVCPVCGSSLPEQHKL